MEVRSPCASSDTPDNKGGDPEEGIEAVDPSYTENTDNPDSRADYEHTCPLWTLVIGQGSEH